MNLSLSLSVDCIVDCVYALICFVAFSARRYKGVAIPAGRSTLGTNYT